MDIKDYILIGGGILIALVVGHGFWIAWRTKREPLRLDIVPDLIPDDVDDMERLRGELPNGGARVINKRRKEPAQVSMELDVPTLTDAAEHHVVKEKPTVHQAPPRRKASNEPLVEESGESQPDLSFEPIVAEPVGRGKTNQRQKNQAASAPPEPVENKVVEELLVVNLIAPKGHKFCGEDLVNALRAQGLRYGDMNIFHRVDPATKAKLYSVANILEPGTFDLSDLDTLASPGMTFFLQLPGPDDALNAFEDMLTTARNLAVELGGDVRDEQMSFLTRQTAEHMRQRIADYARRRLSKRA